MEANIATFIGIIGSAILVLGSALPSRAVTHPANSMKNWLFTIGAVCMTAYSVLNYLDGGPIFFLFLQGIVIFASVTMMCDVPDKIDLPLILSTTILFVVWSLFLFEGVSTIIIVIGLGGIASGYTLKDGTIKRNASLMLGSIFVALFSYLVRDLIFLYLNVFFAIFTGYHIKTLYKKKK